jgi:formylmethanofuran dehydrogenase subunit E
MKLKPQINLIALISHTTDNKTGQKITIKSSCKHMLNKHKANEPSYHFGANNPNEQNNRTTHRNQITLKPQVTLITLN